MGVRDGERVRTDAVWRENKAQTSCNNYIGRHARSAAEKKCYGFETKKH